MPEHTPVTWWRSGEPDLNEFGLLEHDGVTWLCRGPDKLLCTDELQLAGRHNHLNVLSALALGSALKMPLEGLIEGAKQYRGLPHRCQLIGRVKGVSFINDSKGTNIGATAAALEGLAGVGKIWLIIGGQGKGQDFSLLKPVLTRINVRLLVMGEATEQIRTDLGEDTPMDIMSSLEDAVNFSAASAQPGDTVLLSPACASFDMFTSYVERGERFQAAVAALEVVA